MVTEKHDLLKQRYESKGATVVSTALGTEKEWFVEPNPNSHFTAAGRSTMAAQIADRMLAEGWVNNVAIAPSAE